jgi:hypothetical protein
MERNANTSKILVYMKAGGLCMAAQRNNRKQTRMEQTKYHKNVESYR